MAITAQCEVGGASERQSRGSCVSRLAVESACIDYYGCGCALIIETRGKQLRPTVRWAARSVSEHHTRGSGAGHWHALLHWAV